ncbi:NAD(P)-binding domain-containing protein [Kineosporia sp. A_224]|uniref:NAD(P)-binding domain-containing protein n=1 Tax=Kineosporia sp. A_224 TaxID=1962180 RepID=UPI000B4B13F6|nr:NAD(P)-binding domain-containing protein [Kineosporia sp. A_224]
MSTVTSPADLPVVVLGAGPVGLAAAAHLHARSLPFVVLEAGPHAGAAVTDWGHVRLFSPWRWTVDAAARALLDDAGWTAPDPGALPTGADLVAQYLRPLAAVPALAPHVRYGERVVAVARRDVDVVRTAGREASPFVVRLESGEELLGRAVVDASGTWRTPNPLGGNGLPALGEGTEVAVEPALPDVPGADRDRFAGRHTLVVGSGHSAAGTLAALVDLAAQAPGTEVTWAVRRGSAEHAFGGGTADALPARGELGATLQTLVAGGAVRLVTGFAVHALARTADGRVAVTSTGGDALVVDRVVAATGFRADHGLTTELRLDVDPVLGATRALAPLIDPNEHSCGTVPPHGVDELSHPEAGYYVVGMKSYGRAPTFLMATGYEQVRSVAAALAGDWAAAREVHLDLPETGVCSGVPDALGTWAAGAPGPSLLPVGAGPATGAACCG